MNSMFWRKHPQTVVDYIPLTVNTTVQQLASLGRLTIDASNPAMPTVTVEFVGSNSFGHELCLGKAIVGLNGRQLAIAGCAEEHQRRFLANELACALTHRCHDVSHVEYYDAIHALLEANAAKLRELGETTRVAYTDRELTGDANHPVTLGEHRLMESRQSRLAKWHDYLNSLKTGRSSFV